MLWGRCLLLSCACALFLAPSGGGAELIVNGSFEDGNHTGGNFTRVVAGSTALTGWTVGAPAVDWHKAVVGFGPAHSGNLMVDLNLDGGTTGAGTLSQSFATTAGAEYILSFFLSGPGSSFPSPRQVKVQVANEEHIFSQPASPVQQIEWGQQTLTFTAVDATTTLTFLSVNTADFWGPVLDDVSVIAVPSVVPEPTSAALLGLGLVGLFLARRARSR